ncbi:hypothetical protein M514_01735 [Trichuris suis]|uniref:Uncharacterized protein n=1 Tax=Trichuris suis TaxID=68888 RepID=A0A085MJ28_9BILA|nr:hypothetical protein M513_01735 [Trichuris suis]KFD72615.1 hypothetical protein M514_01735 [Trichuris suis]
MASESIHNRRFAPLGGARHITASRQCESFVNSSQQLIPTQQNQCLYPTPSRYIKHTEENLRSERLLAKDRIGATTFRSSFTSLPFDSHIRYSYGKQGSSVPLTQANQERIPYNARTLPIYKGICQSGKLVQWSDPIATESCSQVKFPMAKSYPKPILKRTTSSLNATGLGRMSELLPQSSNFARGYLKSLDWKDDIKCCSAYQKAGSGSTLSIYDYDRMLTNLRVAMVGRIERSQTRCE